MLEPVPPLRAGTAGAGASKSARGGTPMPPGVGGPSVSCAKGWALHALEATSQLGENRGSGSARSRLLVEVDIAHRDRRPAWQVDPNSL
eukprot:1026483-Pyramimonas_sp.AAC.1